MLFARLCFLQDDEQLLSQVSLERFVAAFNEVIGAAVLGEAGPFYAERGVMLHFQVATLRPQASAAPPAYASHSAAAASPAAWCPQSAWGRG